MSMIVTTVLKTVWTPTKRFVILIFLLGGYISAHAQKADQFNSWWYYYGQHTISNKISVQTLYSWCRSDFVKNWQQSIFRTGINYHYEKSIEFGVGYDWVILFPYGEQPVSEKRTEHRIFEQLVLKQKISDLSVKHTFRLEQRFFAIGMRQRARYQFSVKHPLIKSESDRSLLDIKFSNELLLNVEQSSHGYYFGQNRLYIGVDIPVKNELTISSGYMNQYIRQGSGQVENNHTLMMGLTYNLDFRKR